MIHGQISPRKRPLEQQQLSLAQTAASLHSFADSKKTKFEEPIRTRRGPWTAEEDELLSNLVKKHGTKKWAHIAELVPGRVGKQCRERWLNHLRTDVKKTAWTEEEDMTLIRAQQELGNRWSAIARLLPGRPENSVKNRWNSLCNKRKRYSGDHESVATGSDDGHSIGTSASEESPSHRQHRVTVRSGANTVTFPYDVADRGPSPQMSYCADPHAFMWSLYSNRQQQQQQQLPQLMLPSMKPVYADVMSPGGQPQVSMQPAPPALLNNDEQSSTTKSNAAETPKGRGANGLLLLAALCT